MMEREVGEKRKGACQEERKEERKYERKEKREGPVWRRRRRRVTCKVHQQGLGRRDVRFTPPTQLIAVASCTGELWDSGDELNFRKLGKYIKSN